MIRHLCVLGFALLPLFSIAGENQSLTDPGAAAKALSFVAIGGTKLAVTHETPSNPGLDRECVLKLDDYALSEMFEGLLHQQLTEAQIAGANHFYSAPLAGKFNQFTLQQILVAKGKKVDSPMKLTASEVAAVNSFATSESGIALTKVASQSNTDMTAKLFPALTSLLWPCRT